MTFPLIFDFGKEPNDDSACLFHCADLTLSHVNVSEFYLKSAKVEREPTCLKLSLDKLTSDGLGLDMKLRDLLSKIVHSRN